MSPKRFYYIMIGVVSLLGLGIILSATQGNSVLGKQSNKLLRLKTDNQVLDAEQVSLTKAKKDVQKYSLLQQQAQAIVPQDKDQAEAVREIVNIAAAKGVKIAAITFPASSLGGIGGTAAPLAKTTPLTQVQSSGIAGVFVMPITIDHDTNSPISYETFISFLGALEQNRRTAQVSSVTIQPASHNASLLTFNLIVNVYLKPWRILTLKP